ncbi:MAG: protein translocase subunit SecF [Propioniciclava sp.]|uniref:protein translocase subunit SecF n=1 Tax=Propioniciclava sp. TaxID=2038686 RepID=UPI0039E539A1
MSEHKQKTSLAHKLYTGELSYDFIGNRKRWYLVSAIIVVICVLGVAIRGLNLSIDFTGGSEFTVPVQVTATTIDDYRDTVADSGLPELGEIKVNTVGTNQVRIQVRALNAEEINDMTGLLAEKTGIPAEQVTNNLIGASWGQQITQQGVIALVIFLVLVSLMIWAYFRNWKMSVAAIVALLHDLVLTVGVFALLQFAFTPASLIGMLTILGYSLYDTVVVFDKVRENTRGITEQTRSFSEATNLAINQVLVRSVNTTIIGVLPVAALLVTGVFVLGTGPLKDLGLALFVGMIAGAYSSIVLAAPMFAQMKEREPAMVAHRKRLERRDHKPAKKAKATTASVAAGAPVLGAPAAEASLEQAEPIDPVQLGAVPAEALRERQQPRHSTRAQRKKG